MGTAATPKRSDFEHARGVARRAAPVRNRFGYTAALVATDCLAVVLAFFLAFILRTSLLPKFGLRLTAIVSADPYFEMPWLLLVWPVVFHYEGLYRAGMGTWDELIRILQAGSFAALLVMGATFVSHAAEAFSRIIVLATGLFALLLVPALRNYVRTRFLAPRFHIRILVVTGTPPGPDLSRRIAIMRDCGYEHAGTLPLDTSQDDADLRNSIEREVDRCQPEEMMLYPAGLDEEQFRRLLRFLESVDCPLRILSSLPLVLKLQANVHNLDGVLLFDIDNGLAKPVNRFIKRAMDLVGGAIILLLCLPLLMVVAIVIKLDSRGSVFYRHRRLDSKGQSFLVYKFRTMHQDADTRLREWLTEGDERAAEFQQRFKLRDDPRVTRVGKFLRKSSLDELPQLINVLRGEMSLVGPRPIVPEEVSKYGQDIQYLKMAKGGMTGLWQVGGRSNVDYSERVALDIYYIRNWSVWTDLVVLLKTATVLIHREDAY